MSDYSRRNRGKNNGDDDFDWERFDRQTSGNNEQQLRRRRTADGSRRRRVVPQEDEYYSSYRYEQDADSRPPKRKRKRKKKQLTEKQKMFRKRVRLVILVIVMVFVVVCSGMFIGMYAAVSREIKDMNIRSLALNSTSAIYYTDRYGNEKELDTIQSDSNRIWVESGEIAPVFKDAIVSIEDERFYQHNGVDIKRTLGATVKYVAAKLGIGESNYGGSTITQQVIKNITREDDFKATRKIKEMMRAIALERQLTKDEILTMYCNIVYFANNCNGVEAAAKTYFNKSALELNLQEAASIAGITQFPSQYDPIANPQNNVTKRNTVLKKMLELGKIDEIAYSTAVASQLETSDEYREAQSEITSYFVDQVVNDVIRDFMNRYQYSEEFATSQVYNGGLKIYATVDADIQETMEDVFENEDFFPGGDSQAAMLILDPYTGQIKGLIGGLGKKKDIRGWNRATQAIRQPGSAIKPLSVYGPAIDHGDINEVTIINDEEIEIGNDNWKPKNAYDGFKGEMTIREAVARSSNIPAVKVLDTVGLSTSFGYLENKFHISTLLEEDKNYSSLALGGLTQGVTVKEMAAAYGVFVNNGKYITPYTYTRVLDSQGNVILENYVNEQQAMSDSAAFITADLLSGPVNMSYGTATAAELDCGMPAYGKTGTTDEDFDKWFVGFTPYYVGAVWYGFDTPSSLSRAGIRGNPCLTAWKLVFDDISDSQDYRELTPPSTVVESYVCSRSGQLANDSCEAVKAYFVDGTQPKSYCTNHYNLHQSSGFYEQNNKPTPTPTATQSGTSGATTPPQSGTTGSNGNSSSSGNTSGGGESSTSGSGSSSSESSTGSSGSSTGSSGSGTGSSGSSTGSSGSGTGSSGSGSSSSGNTSGGGESSSSSGGNGSSSSGAESGDNNTSGGSSDVGEITAE